MVTRCHGKAETMVRIHLGAPVNGGCSTMAVPRFVRPQSVSSNLINHPIIRWISSVGRAARLHRVGRQFETVIQHQLCLRRLVVNQRFCNP